MSRRSRLLAIGVGTSMLSPGSLFAWQGTDSATQASDASDTFELSRSVELELNSPGRAPLRVRDEAQVNAKLRGLSSDFYPAGDLSAAGGAAKVRLLREDDASIDVKLDASTKAHGWSVAKGTARATIAMTVPPAMAEMPAILRLTADKPGDVALMVIAPDGSRLAPIEGKPGHYLIRDGSIGRYLIQSAVTAEVGHEGGPGPKSDVESVNLQASIERGPILFSRLQTQFIYKGAETDDYKEVGSILLDGLLHCTATLVAPKTIVTAAHCVAGYESQIRQKRFKFATGLKASAPDGTFVITAVDYPSDISSGYFYNAGNYADDIALAYLETAPAITPVAIHRGSPGWTDLQLQRLLFVGYGYNGTDTTSAGVKREASWTIGQVEPRKVSWRTSGASTCAFDSGGPAFQGAGQLLVAVTSMGARDCTSGINTRVDAFVPWLSGKLK